MDGTKISAVVQACINDARNAREPYRSINESLGLLKRHGWSEAERLEVQMRVLQAMKQLRTVIG